MSRHIATTALVTTIATILLTATTAGGASSPGQALPTNLTPPTISGTAQQGQTLTASTGTWSGRSLSYSFQWLRCDSTGAGCSAITGASNSTDVLSSADGGQTLRVMVTASNRNGSAAATSAATGVVTATSSTAPPSNSSLPTVSGTAQQGQTLTTTNGTWSGSPTSYTYDWTRCDTAGGNCAVISGTKASSYTLTSADVNHTLRAYVNASNAAGTGTALSAATGVVTATSSSAPPSNSSLPTVSGTAQQGLTLTTTNGTWSGSPTSYTYAWTRCDTAGGNCAVISGSNAASYTLTSADVNNTLRAYVNASNSAGTGTALSAATGVVTATSSTDTSVIDDEGTIRMGNSPAYMTNGDKFGTLALGSYYNLFQALPGRTIKYVNGAFCLDGDDVAASSATCRANGWLLHNSSGQELNSSYGFLLANTGNVSFQNDFLQRVLNFLTLHPWIDGVYFDNGALSMPQQMGVSYPIYDQSNRLLWSNDTDFQRSQIAFMANVAGALKARGYVVGYNARGYDGTGASNDGTLATWWMDQYAPYVTAAMIEYWHQNQAACCGSHAVELSGGDTWFNHWDQWQNLETYAQSKGLEFWPADYIAQSGEDSQCRFLRGSYLLDWNGKGSIMLLGWTNGTDIWNSCTATDLGFPSGAKYQPVAGVWERQYTRGYVIVNPTKSTVTVGSDTIPSGGAILHQN